MYAVEQFPFLRVCVLGASEAGVGVMTLLRHYKLDVRLVDDRPASDFRSLIRSLNRQQVSYFFGREAVADNALRRCDVLVVSSGVSFAHPLIEEAMDRDMMVIPEIELATAFAKFPLTAITGSHGRSVATVLLGKFAAESGINAVVSGCTGRPFAKTLISTEGVSRRTELISEVFPSQLVSIEDYHPHIAVILNIDTEMFGEDYLREEYIEANLHIGINQTADDFLVLNQDDETVMDIVEEANAQVYTFSLKEEVEQGAFVRDGMVYLKEQGETISFCDVSELPLPGQENVQSCLAALVASRCIGIDSESLRKTLARFNKGFRGIDGSTHRDSGFDYPGNPEQCA